MALTKKTTKNGWQKMALVVVAMEGTRRRGAKCKRKITRISTHNQIAKPAATVKQNTNQGIKCHETYKIQWRRLEQR